jgi:hypothetical protein
LPIFSQENIQSAPARAGGGGERVERGKASRQGKQAARVERVEGGKASRQRKKAARVERVEGGKASRQGESGESG